MSNNPYVKFVKEFREKNPSLSYKEAMVQASKEYKGKKSGTKSVKKTVKKDKEEENVKMEISGDMKMTKSQRTKLIKEFNKIKKDVMEELKKGTLDKSSDLYLNFEKIGKVLRGKSQNNVYAKALKRVERGMGTKTFQKAKDRQVKRAERLLQKQANLKGKRIRRPKITGKEYDRLQSRDNRIRDKVGRLIREEIEKGNPNIDVKSFYKKAEREEKIREEKMKKIKDIDVNFQARVNRDQIRYRGQKGKRQFIYDYIEAQKKQGNNLSYKNAEKIISRDKIYVDYMRDLNKLEEGKLEEKKLDAIQKVLAPKVEVFGSSALEEKVKLLTPAQRTFRLKIKDDIAPLVNNDVEFFYAVGDGDKALSKVSGTYLSNYITKVERIQIKTEEPFLNPVIQRLEELRSNLTEYKKKIKKIEKTQEEGVSNFIKDIQEESPLKALDKKGGKAKATKDETLELRKWVDKLNKINDKMADVISKHIDLQEKYDNDYSGIIPLSEVSTTTKRKKLIEKSKKDFEKVYKSWEKIEEETENRDNHIDDGEADTEQKAWIDANDIEKEANAIGEPQYEEPQFELSVSGASTPTISPLSSPEPSPPPSPKPPKKTKAEINKEARQKALESGEKTYKNADGVVKRINMTAEERKKYGKKKPAKPKPKPKPEPEPAPEPEPEKEKKKKKKQSTLTVIPKGFSQAEVDEARKDNDLARKYTRDFGTLKANEVLDFVEEDEIKKGVAGAKKTEISPTNPNLKGGGKELVVKVIAPYIIQYAKNTIDEIKKDQELSKSIPQDFMDNVVENIKKGKSPDGSKDLEIDGKKIVVNKSVEDEIQKFYDGEKTNIQLAYLSVLPKAPPSPPPKPKAEPIDFKKLDATEQQRLIDTVGKDYLEKLIADSLSDVDLGLAAVGDADERKMTWDELSDIQSGVTVTDEIDGKEYKGMGDELKKLIGDYKSMWEEEVDKILKKKSGGGSPADLTGLGFADEENVDKSVKHLNDLYDEKVNGGNLKHFKYLPIIQKVGKFIADIGNKSMRNLLGGHLEDMVFGDLGEKPIDKIEHHLTKLEEVRGGDFSKHLQRISTVSHMIGNILDKDTRNMYGKALEDIVLN